MVTLYLIVLSLPFIAWYLISYLKWKKNTYNYMAKLPGIRRFPIVGTYYYFFGVPKEGIFGYAIVHGIKTSLLLEIIDKLLNHMLVYGNLAHSWNGSTPEIHIQKAEHVEVSIK